MWLRNRKTFFQKSFKEHSPTVWALIKFNTHSSWNTQSNWWICCIVENHTDNRSMRKEGKQSVNKLRFKEHFERNWRTTFFHLATCSMAQNKAQRRTGPKMKSILFHNIFSDNHINSFFEKPDCLYIRRLMDFPSLQYCWQIRSQQTQWSDCSPPISPQLDCQLRGCVHCSS